MLAVAVLLIGACSGPERPSPTLNQSEYGVLVQWLAQGAQEPPPAEPSTTAAAQIEQWEKFLNGPSNRGQVALNVIDDQFSVSYPDS